MSLPVILIGPVGVGKSTLGRLLCQSLGVSRHSIDDLRWNYFKEIGYDEEEQRRIANEEGWPGIARYWLPFEAYAVERLLTEAPSGVIDFGGGYTIQHDPSLRARVEKALAPFDNVILLLPSPSLEESVQVLEERACTRMPSDFDMAEHVAQHFATRPMAKRVIYTEGKSPEETRDEIIKILTT